MPKKKNARSAAAAALARSRWDNLSADERSEQAAKGAQTRLSRMTPEQRSQYFRELVMRRHGKKPAAANPKARRRP